MKVRMKLKVRDEMCVTELKIKAVPLLDGVIWCMYAASGCEHGPISDRRSLRCEIKGVSWPQKTTESGQDVGHYR
jgi:hypothetical protein